MVKKILSIFILSFMMLSNNTYAHDVRIDGKWRNLVKAIAHIESRHNTDAVSSCGTYVGFLQISKIVVDDCNRIIGEQKYEYEHRYDKQSSIEMFYIIQGYYNPKGDIEKAIRIWNGGSNFSKKKTDKYYQEVFNEYIKINKM